MKNEFEQSLRFFILSFLRLLFVDREILLKVCFTSVSSSRITIIIIQLRIIQNLNARFF